MLLRLVAVKLINTWQTRHRIAEDAEVRLNTDSRFDIALVAGGCIGDSDLSSGFRV